MNPLEPQPSARLRRAAEAERTALEQKRTKAEIERQRLAAELHQIEMQLLAFDERLEMLDRLAGPSEGGADDRADAEPRPAERNDKTILRGTGIRETATRVLAQHPEGHRPVHYRRWFEMVEEAGYAVAGKDPLAVFLTQISRSPAVKRSTEAGIYSLDPQASDRLRRRLASLQAELREVTSSKADEPTDLVRVRKQRERLHAEVRKTERALDEVLRVMKPARKAQATGSRR